MDTIFALSTPVGGAIAVIRVSGPLAGDIAKSLTGRDLMKTPRIMTRAYLKHDGDSIDDAMAVCFNSPKSYTGEDMLELYCHGSQAVVRELLCALSSLGLRGAEPGEFTKRAFLNGKMDLIEAEAVMDLINAQASLSAKAALEQMRGRLGARLNEAEELLYDALSFINASIDYPDELEDEGGIVIPQKLSEAQNKLKTLLEEGFRARVLREGFKLVIIGPPNAGKSSLYNALLGYDRAIVTPEAGTTRDLLEESLILGGIPFRISDTAGIRNAISEAEKQGVLRAREALDYADAVLLLLDTSCALNPSYTDYFDKADLILLTKSDLKSVWDCEMLNTTTPHMRISAVTGEGIESLKQWLINSAGPVRGAYLTNERHIKNIERAIMSIEQAQHAEGEDEKATDIRDALMLLGELSGHVVDDEVIELIFSRFCVGK